MRPIRAVVAAAVLSAALAACGVNTPADTTDTAEPAPVTHTGPPANATYTLSIQGSAINGPYIGDYLTGGSDVTGADPEHPQATAQAIAGYLLSAGSQIGENQISCAATSTAPALTYRCVATGGSKRSVLTAQLKQHTSN